MVVPYNLLSTHLRAVEDASPYIHNSQLLTLNLQSFALQRDIGGTTLSRYTKLMLGRDPEITEKEKCT